MSALLLAGGGAKGAFQAGLLAEFGRQGYWPFTDFYGTSAGALNAPFAEWGEIIELNTLWDRPDLEKLVHRKWSKLRSMWRQLRGARGWYDNTPLFWTLCDTFARYPAIERTWVSLTDLVSGDGKYSLATPETCYMSATIPGVYAPALDRYVDGGLRSMAPVSKAVDDGHDEMVLVLCNPTRLGTYAGRDTMHDAARAMEIMLHEIMLGDLGTTRDKNLLRSSGATKIDGTEYRHIDVQVISPNEETGKSLDFSRDHTRRAKVAGVRAARAFLDR